MSSDFAHVIKATLMEMMEELYDEYSLESKIFILSKLLSFAVPLQQGTHLILDNGGNLMEDD